MKCSYFLHHAVFSPGSPGVFHSKCSPLSFRCLLRCLSLTTYKKWDSWHLIKIHSIVFLGYLSSRCCFHFFSFQFKNKCPSPSPLMATPAFPRSLVHTSASVEFASLPASISFYYLTFLQQRVKPTHFSPTLSDVWHMQTFMKAEGFQHTFLPLWSPVSMAVFWNITWYIFLSL